MAQKANSLNNKKQTDYETIIAIDEMFEANRENDLLKTEKVNR